MSIAALSVEQLTKRFNEQDAVYDISFSIKPGEIVAVKGQTGSGKTTLLKLIAGVISPTSGSVKIQEKIIVPESKENVYKIGLMLQSHGTYSRLTVRQHLAFFQKLYGVSDSRLNEIIQLAGLIDRQNDQLKKFSQSFIARVKLAQTMLHNPPVLLLDEPTANLDLETMEILRRMIVKAANDGAAVLLATSSYEEAQVLAHRTAKMHKGRIESWESTVDAKEPVEFDDKEEQTQTSHIKIEKIPAKVNDRIILFNPTELIFIESQDGASILHAGDENFPCPLTLGELEERLKPFGFFRCHRSYIVNLQRVREVIPWTRNSFSLVLNDYDKTTIPLSKNNMKELEGIIGM